MRTVIVFVPGILSWPGTAEGWTDRAVTWTHGHTDARAEKFEYWSGIIFRRLRQDWRAAHLANLLSFYHSFGYQSVNLVGHSNGCDVILRALRKSPQNVDSIHFVAPACDTNEACSMFRYLRLRRFLRKVVVYIGGADRAMNVARKTFGILKLWHLGYGTMGATPPAEIETALNFAGVLNSVVYEPDYEHGTWFHDDREIEPLDPFTKTMKHITFGI